MISLIWMMPGENYYMAVTEMVLYLPTVILLKQRYPSLEISAVSLSGAGTAFRRKVVRLAWSAGARIRTDLSQPA